LKGLLGRKAKDNSYDFGWGMAWSWGFLIGGIVSLAIAFGLLMINSSLFLLSGILFLAALQLFMGDLALRFIYRMDSELVLPYVDLLTSDRDLVLDAGCGSGRTSIAIGKILKNGRIVAIDRFDADYIADGGNKLLERNLKIANIMDKVDIQTQDITGLKFEDGKFDASVSSYMLDHLGDKKLKGLREINRVLKKRGKFLFIVAVPNYFTYMLFSVISRLSLISVKDWKQLFREADFKCISEGDINGGHYFLLEKPA
jgi:Methylase involved in ubiquinone/menaquinone biosynthesis